MKKRTLGTHLDAWQRFLAWYWKYTIKPRFTNIPRRIRYHLGITPKTKWDFKYAKDIFYSDGQILSETRSNGHAGPNFKEWWKENAGFEARDGNQKKREDLKAHIQEMRDIIKDL